MKKDLRLHSIKEKLESMRDFTKNLPTPTNPEQQSHLDQINNEMNDLKSYIDDVIYNNEIRSDKKFIEKRIEKIKKIKK